MYDALPEVKSPTLPVVVFEEICRTGRVGRHDEATVSLSDESFAGRRFRRTCIAMAFVKSEGTLLSTRAHPVQIPGPRYHSDVKSEVVAVRDLQTGAVDMAR